MAAEAFITCFFFQGITPQPPQSYKDLYHKIRKSQTREQKHMKTKIILFTMMASVLMVTHLITPVRAQSDENDAKAINV
jgi:hypothetical protein